MSAQNRDPRRVLRFAPARRGTCRPGEGHTWLGQSLDLIRGLRFYFKLQVGDIAGFQCSEEQVSSLDDCLKSAAFIGAER
ncbi:MAG: hypothetical protein JWM04_871 [Verrucomicrobiales bacterium]|nr:hypothetical protein [Verrucomicrobiales bacterium]